MKWLSCIVFLITVFLSLGCSFTASITALSDSLSPISDSLLAPNDNASTLIGDFEIQGVSGQLDIQIDDQLIWSTNPKVNWTTPTNASSFEVNIWDDSVQNILCTRQISQQVTELEFMSSECNLAVNSWYKIQMEAKNASTFKAPTNNFLRFFVKPNPLLLNFEIANINGSNGASMLTSVTSHSIAGGTGIYSGWTTGIGDFNGDGFDDIASGKRHDDLYVVYGSPSGIPNNLDLSTMSASQGFYHTEIGREYWGSVVSKAGDLDKDGYDDFLVAATDDLNGSGAYKGSVQIIYGTSDHTLGLSTATIRTTWAENHLGGSLYPFGDFNGDGWIDLLLGAGELAWSDPNGSHAYLYYGKSSRFTGNYYTNTLSAADGFTINDSTAPSWRCTVAGTDLNGDGKHDLIFGNSNNTERVYVYFGTNSLPSNIDLTSVDGTNGFFITNGQANSEFGYDAADAKDVNGDGYPDIIISASGFDYGGLNDRGVVYVLFGGPNALWNTDTDGEISTSQINGTNGVIILGESANDNLGDSIDGLGDFNGDGFSDLLITAPNADEVSGMGVDVGRAYIIFGGPKGIRLPLTSGVADLSQLTSDSGIRIVGNTTYDIEFSSPAGDVNGDGKADVIVGTGSTPEADGQIYTIYGY